MSNKDRAVQKDAGWRKAMPDVREKTEYLIEYLEHFQPGGYTFADGTKGADVVRRLLHLLDSQSANVRAEERAAWDEYAAGSLASTGHEMAAQDADRMLEERRKRFPSL